MRGEVTLSIEVELGWGVHDIGDYEYVSEDGEAERVYLQRLLGRCEDLDLPVSFDVVGHLFLDECDGRHPGPYPDGWFDADPGTGFPEDGRFYAPDVVDRIASSSVTHELCTHTFSHTLATQPAETVAADLEAAQRVHERHLGRRTKTLVPPRHAPPPDEMLADAGLEIVRCGRDTGDKSRPARVRELVAGPVPTWEPTVEGGVVHAHCTTYPSLTAPAVVAGQERQKHPALRSIPVGVRQRLHLRALRNAVDRAAATGGTVNLWCHLFDLANPYQWPPLSRFLGYLARRRDAGDVAVRTLAGLNEAVRERREVRT